jgi:hypothetical protein
MDGHWKAIRNKRRDAAIELYDLKTDLAEAKNVAAENPKLVERARILLEKEHTDSPDWPVKDAPAKRGCCALAERTSNSKSLVRCTTLTGTDRCAARCLASGECGRREPHDHTA